MAMSRMEYPRPDLVRRDWLSLNGEWDFSFDDHNEGVIKDWVRHFEVFGQKIIAPFPYQSKLSGIHQKENHPVIWYHRTFEIPGHWSGKHILLNFGAVDFETVVWVNGRLAGTNTGGYVPFTFDISDLLNNGTNHVVIRVSDEDNINQPRGKQNAKKEPWGCWYTRVSGIWQSVWLEPVSRIHLKSLKLTPDIDTEELAVHYELSDFAEGLQLSFTASFEKEAVATKVIPVSKSASFFADNSPMKGWIPLSIKDQKLWSPEKPQLYDFKIRLYAGDEILDEIDTYFGMRKISVENGRICLNNQPYYLRMVLDQGYWPGAIYTPESIEMFKKDIGVTKQLGFNGIRMHQKIEDPYFYYFCDCMGLLVWEEMPSCYHFDTVAVQHFLDEWRRAIDRDYNHPCIMAWVPMNESWGVEPLMNDNDKKTYNAAAAYLDTLYHFTKALDDTRLIISNDGWQHATTDIVSIHEYTQDNSDLEKRYREFKSDRMSAPFSHKFKIILPGYAYHGQPIMITEFGGVKVEEQGASGWGYGEAAKTYREMANRIGELVDTILNEPEICGYCYTQLTDVEQEVNGLLTSDRRLKGDINQLAAIFKKSKL